MKKILLFADWYEPGYKAGGPIRSCVNFVRSMRHDYRIYVFTRDRDLGSQEPYPGITVDKWNADKDGTSIYYCSPRGLSWKNIRRQLVTIDADLILLESMFSPKFTIYPLLISRWSRTKGEIVLSPNGMLRDSAIRFKSFKKKIFLRSFRWLGIQRSIRFRATDETEQNDVRRYFGPAARVELVPNFTLPPAENAAIVEKQAGQLKLICVGRIHPVKNLDYLLEVLGGVRARIILTIVGSVEDKAFWDTCQPLLAALPAEVAAQYAGEIPFHQLTALTAAHHIFTSPTKGENFGYAIFEALSLGKPVLISDQTPWRNLEGVKAGWDLPLDRPDLFRKAIERAAAFNQEEYNEWSQGAGQYAAAYSQKWDLRNEYLKLLS